MRREILFYALALFVFAHAAVAQRKLVGDDTCPDLMKRQTMGITSDYLSGTIPENLKELVKSAEVIPYGTIHRSYPVLKRFPPFVSCVFLTEHRIAVERFLKPKVRDMPPEPVYIFVQQNGAKVGKFVFETDDPLMEEGRMYLFFLKRFPNDTAFYPVLRTPAKFRIENGIVLNTTQLAKMYEKAPLDKLVSDITEILAAK